MASKIRQLKEIKSPKPVKGRPNNYWMTKVIMDDSNIPYNWTVYGNDDYVTLKALGQPLVWLNATVPTTITFATPLAGTASQYYILVAGSGSYVEVTSTNVSGDQFLGFTMSGPPQPVSYVIAPAISPCIQEYWINYTEAQWNQFTDCEWNIFLDVPPPANTATININISLTATCTVKKAVSSNTFSDRNTLGFGPYIGGVVSGPSKSIMIHFSFGEYKYVDRIPVNRGTSIRLSDLKMYEKDKKSIILKEIKHGKINNTKKQIRVIQVQTGNRWNFSLKNNS